jgi:hypothetical protein
MTSRSYQLMVCLHVLAIATAAIALWFPNGFALLGILAAPVASLVFVLFKSRSRAGVNDPGPNQHVKNSFGGQVATSQAPLTRRPVQFSLRSLFILTYLVAILFGGFHWFGTDLICPFFAVAILTLPTLAVALVGFISQGSDWTDRVIGGLIVWFSSFVLIGIVGLIVLKQVEFFD